MDNASQISISTSNLTVQGEGTLTATQAKLGVVETIENHIAAKDWTGLANWMASTNFTTALQTEITSGARLQVASSLTAIDGDSSPGSERDVPVFENTGLGNGFSLSHLAFQNVDYKTTNLQGGGVVSAYRATDSVTLGTMDTLYFNMVKVKVDGAEGQLWGGGVVGAAASFTANATGNASIGDVTGSSFAGTSVKFTGTGTIGYTGLLSGGGVVGARTVEGNATIGGVIGSSFAGTSMDFSGQGRESGKLHGGGVVGAQAETGHTGIGDVTGSAFAGTSLKFSGTGNGGSQLEGGGVIGASSGNKGNASIGKVTGSSFAGTSLVFEATGVSCGWLHGGGVVGVRANTGDAGIGVVSGTSFAGTSLKFSGTVTGDKSGLLYGGGVIGAAVNSQGTARIGGVRGTSFTGTSLNLDGTGDDSGILWGGGVVGVYSQKGAGIIGSITDSRIDGVAITVAKDVRGGGAIGAFNDMNLTYDPLGDITGDNASASLGNISRSEFTGIRINAGREVFAGAVYSSGLAGRLTVSDSLFLDNNAASGGPAGRVHAGAIGIDTIYTTGNPDGHAVTLTATAGGVTRFDGNAMAVGAASRTGSVHFGRMNTEGRIAYGFPNTFYQNAPHSRADARLDVTPALGGWVDLRDPVTADLRGQRTGEFINPADADAANANISTTNGARYTGDDTHRFTMVLGGRGRIHWGGKNDLFADGGGGVSFRAGPAVTLLGDFQLNNAGVAHVVDVTGTAVDTIKRDLTVDFEAGSGFTLDLTNRQESLAVSPRAMTPCPAPSPFPAPPRWTRSSSASASSRGAG